jgi:hypothetical protein
MAAAVANGASIRAEPVRPQPPPPRKVLYDPDQGSCQPDNLETSYRRQMLPWADQPERVQTRLRDLQVSLLRASLKRCVARGLLTAEEAGSLERRLQLPSATPGAAAQSSGQRP